MNVQTTIEKMKKMRLNGMSEHYHQSLKEKQQSTYTADELMAVLIDAEWESRQNRKIHNLIKTAGFRLQASPLNIDYTSRRSLDKTTFERLLSLQFIKQAENIILTGPTGVGKSYLAQAIGHKACQETIKTLCFNSAALMESIKLAKLEGTYIKLLNKIHKADLLIIDDFGLHPFDNYARQALMDIIEDRYDRVSTIVTSQIPVKDWHEAIGEGTIADAILDRLVYSSHRIELEGQSLRKNKLLIG
jgi:DNA replication protein DnaC